MAEENQQQRDHSPVLIEAYDDEIAPMSPFSSAESSEESTSEESDEESETRIPTMPNDSKESNRHRPAGNEHTTAPATAKLETGSDFESTSSEDRKMPARSTSDFLRSTATSQNDENQLSNEELNLPTSFSAKDTKKSKSKRDSRVCDHTYRDLSHIPADMKYAEMLENREGEYGFLIKLHDALEKYPSYFDWMPHGRCFRIIVPKCLERYVFPEFFNHSRLHTFLKQLINWGFKHITRGRDRNSYYHEAFLKGLPHLSRFMTYKVRCRLRPDPDNEPCFYRIHKLSPLPIFRKKNEADETQAISGMVDPSESSYQLALWQSITSHPNSSQASARAAAAAAAAATRNSTVPLESLYVAASAGRSSTLGANRSLAWFSLETNRMNQVELEQSLRINLMQQQQLLRAQSRIVDTPGQNNHQQSGNVDMNPMLNSRIWHP